VSEMLTALKELVMEVRGCDGDCANCGVGEEEVTLKDLVGMLRSVIRLLDLPKLTVQELAEVEASLDRIIPTTMLALLTRDMEIVSELPHITLAIIELQERGLEYEPADTFLELLYEIF